MENEEEILEEEESLLLHGGEGGWPVNEMNEWVGHDVWE